MSETSDRHVDLLLLGHLALDQVRVGDTPARQQPGGAVYFGAFAARASGCSCLVVTKLHPDDAWMLEPVTRQGIRVHWTPAGSTAGILNTYEDAADQERRQCQLLSASDPFSLTDLPPQRPAILHVGALVRGQVPESLIPELAQRAPVGLDLQGFVRVDQGDRLVLRPWRRAAQVLEQVRYIKADAAEAEAVTGETDPVRAARALLALGKHPDSPSREVVLTHSDQVTVATDHGPELHQAGLNPTSLVGRTGRGDSCMAAYLAARCQGQDPAWATRYAAALTSLKLEQAGPFAGTRQQVLARMGGSVA